MTDEEKKWEKKLAVSYKRMEKKHIFEKLKKIGKNISLD